MVGSLKPRCRRARSDRISHSRPHKKREIQNPISYVFPFHLSVWARAGGEEGDMGRNGSP